MTWLKVCFALAIIGLSVLATWWLQPLPVEQAAAPSAVSTNVVEASTPSAPLDAGVRSSPRLSLPEPHPLTAAICSPHMVWVEGDYCPAGDSASTCSVPTRAIGTCMDRFEYPNQPGVLPAVMATFPEAERGCRAEGKRLCGEAEWTFACRGILQLDDCQFGRSTSQPELPRLWDWHQVADEVARVSARRASRRSSCVSRHGAFDLAGNVEEWVSAEHSGGYEAAAKGGHSNQSSIGCERSLYVRDPHTRSPLRGFRCCADPLVPPPRRQQEH